MPKFLGTRDIFPQAPWLGRGNSGDQTGQANPFRVFGISGFASLTMFRVAEEGGRQLQPQSSDLHNSCENHPAIMQVQQADLNVCRGNHFFSVPAQPQEPLRRKLRNRQGKDGVLKIFVFAKFLYWWLGMQGSADSNVLECTYTTQSSASKNHTKNRGKGPFNEPSCGSEKVVFWCFPVTWVRNPADIVQKTCSDELLYFGWIIWGVFSASELDWPFPDPCSVPTEPPELQL